MSEASVRCTDAVTRVDIEPARRVCGVLSAGDKRTVQKQRDCGTCTYQLDVVRRIWVKSAFRPSRHQVSLGGRVKANQRCSMHLRVDPGEVGVTLLLTTANGQCHGGSRGDESHVKSDRRVRICAWNLHTGPRVPSIRLGDLVFPVEVLHKPVAGRTTGQPTVLRIAEIVRETPSASRPRPRCISAYQPTHTFPPATN